MRQELITQKSVPDRYNPFFQHQSFEIKGKKQQQNFCNILSLLFRISGDNFGTYRDLFFIGLLIFEN